MITFIQWMNFRNIMMAMTIVFLSAASAFAKMDDEEIIGMLSAINENEINAAEEAIRKGPSAEVLEYAEMMRKEHEKNLDQTMELSEQIGIQPEYNAEAVIKQREEGAEELADLIGLSGEKFDKGYIDSMVKDHKDALEMIDDKLLDDVENVQLKDHLQKTRNHVEQHLEQARRIQEDL